MPPGTLWRGWVSGPHAAVPRPRWAISRWTHVASGRGQVVGVGGRREVLRGVRQRGERERTIARDPHREALRFDSSNHSVSRCRPYSCGITNGNSCSPTVVLQRPKCVAPEPIRVAVAGTPSEPLEAVEVVLQREHHADTRQVVHRLVDHDALGELHRAIVEDGEPADGARSATRWRSESGGLGSSWRPAASSTRRRRPTRRDRVRASARSAAAPGSDLVGRRCRSVAATAQAGIRDEDPVETDVVVVEVDRRGRAADAVAARDRPAPFGTSTTHNAGSHPSGAHAGRRPRRGANRTVSVARPGRPGAGAGDGITTDDRGGIGGSVERGPAGDLLRRRPRASTGHRDRTGR